MTSSWQGRRVLVTGHTGFKGSWLSHWLLRRGAHVFGLALPPDGKPNLFDALDLGGRLEHAICDIRDHSAVTARVAEADPEVIFHLAAQPLVRRSYRAPQETMATNVMGTTNLLDALRGRNTPTAVVIVTTDKVYQNHEQEVPYVEDDRLGGHDPYSASKAAAELVTGSFRLSFFADGPVRIATARAGNVIGGGDWAEDRILPDLARAFTAGRPVVVRNPSAIRPWQHVLEPLQGYMDLAEGLLAGKKVLETGFNFGPDAADQRPVRDLVEAALTAWPGDVSFDKNPNDVHEAACLSLSIDKARDVLGWVPRWSFEEAATRTVHWYRAFHEGVDARKLTDAEITAFEGLTE